MSRHSRRRTASFEQLLDGTRADDSAVSAVLDAARAPATARELAGLDAARTAFFVAGTPVVSEPAAARTGRSRAGHWLPLRALTLISGVALAGGVAVAATSGSFSDTPPPVSTSSAPGSGSGSGVAPGGGGRQPTAAGSASGPGSRGGSSDPHGSPGVSRPAAPRPDGSRHAVHPVHPTHPAHPTHRVHPTHPAHPSKPGQAKATVSKSKHHTPSDAPRSAKK